MVQSHGVPCWVSLMTRSMEVTERFYSAVLGWEFHPGSFGPKSRVARKAGVPVAGATEFAASWQLPVSWTVYFHVQDADQATARIGERGGTVGVGPVRMGDGRAAMAAGPCGATFGLWQGECPAGWSVGTGEAPAWLELHTQDAFAATLFYGEVFAWTGGPGHCNVTYADDQNEAFVRCAGRTVAGVRGGGVEADPDPNVRPHWRAYFQVAEVERAVQNALAAGGEVVSPPTHHSLGCTATLRDPEGGHFAVLSA